jgi:Fe-S cluster assembly scaffold protein SufB
MSHEAAIGRISTGEVAYLQSRGLTEDEAIAMIIRGFLDPGIEGISAELDQLINDIAEISGHGEK